MGRAWQEWLEGLTLDRGLGSRLRRAFERGDAWSNNLKVNAGGGNDCWGLGVARPDLILADLAAITHPDLMPGHQFTVYRKLER